MTKPNHEVSGRPIVGSRSPGIGYIYVAVILFLAIAAGTLLSGGFIPVDPNGPGGPPTLPPYSENETQDAQQILFPSTGPDARNNLQLKTFKVNLCGSQTAIDFLIDTSESMSDDNKMARLQSALRTFTKSITPSTVIGIQTFSGVVDDRVKLDYYRNAKSSITSTIETLTPGGWTRMRDGFQLAKTDLADAITKNKFPGYKYYLVVLTDGVPETPPPRTCLVTFPDPLWGPDGRCFTTEQDPRKPTDIATDLKNLGVDIYAVAIFSTTAQSDTQMRPYLETLLKSSVTAPDSSHYFGTDMNAVNLETILKDLVVKICSTNVGGGDEGTPNPTTANYPFPTYPDNATHTPYQGPGGAFGQ